jgi:hypothetical protein
MRQVSETGQSEIIGDKFVVMILGRKLARVDYLVVEAWPSSLSADERRSTSRLRLNGDSRAVSRPDGTMEAIEDSQTAYFICNDDFRAMKLKMRTKSVPVLHRQPFADTEALWQYLARYSLSQ